MLLKARVALALVAGVFAALAAVTAAGAGYAVVEEHGDQTLISKGRIKTVPTQGRDAFVLDVGRGRMWMTNAEDRWYWEGTVDEFCQGMRQAIGTAMAAMQGQMAAHMKELQEAMAKLGPAERQQMEQMLKMMAPQMSAQGGAQAASAKPRQVTVQSTGETATIAGLPTRKYRVLADGRPYEDLWLTLDAALASEMNVDRMPDTFGRMAGCLSGITKGAKGAEDSVEANPEYLKLYRVGWPLKRVSYEDAQGKPLAGEPKTSTWTVERRDIPESEFAPPADYRRATLDEMFGRSQGRGPAR